MKTLAQLIEVVEPVEVINFADVAVQTIACQPEDAHPSCLYCVIDEFLEYSQWQRGVDIVSTIPPGHIAALLTATPLPEVTLPQVIVTDARRATARAAKFFFAQPDEALRIIGVTGTNGKTTVTHLIQQWLTACNEACGALGTLGFYINAEKQRDVIYTTPLAPTLFRLLREMHDHGMRTVAMEISSHALALDRVFGLDTDVAVFTNLSRDHLDFHGTMERYRDAKVSLFTRLKPAGTAVVNADDPVGRDIVDLTPARVLTIGFSSHTDLRVEQTRYSLQGSAIRARYRDQTFTLSTPLLGAFNVYNLVSALGACLSCGIPLAHLQATSVKLHGAPGRMQRVSLGAGRMAIIDYAHTPAALAQTLAAVRALNPGRIITVFGCGGDRDRGKRPLMGAVAAQASDLCVVTSDNPRREDPLAIIADILAGMPKEGIMVEADRHSALAKALAVSRAGDVIVVAGKGHETYQIVGDERIPFSDYEELIQLL